jgi:HEAT repeat protein
MATPSRLETLDTLRFANLDVAFATAFVTLFSGSLMVGFVQHLGGGDFALGLLAALPSLMGLLQIPGAALGRGNPSYKKYIARGGSIWRYLHFPIIFLPLLPVPDQAKLAILFLCISVAALSHNLVNATYNEWIGTIVPERARGWYFSQRTLIATVTGMIVGLIGARLLDLYKGQPYEHHGYTIIFSLGWICAIVSMLYYRKMSDTEREAVVKPDFNQMVEVVRAPLRDRNFRQIMLFVIVFTASQGFANNLFSAFALESLQMPFFYLQLTSIAATLGTIATVRAWGFLADRYGNKPLLLLLSMGVTLTPLMWVILQPGKDQLLINTTILFVGHIFTGIFWSGVGVVQMNLYLATSTPQNRANYLASALTIAAVTLAISPLLGSAMLNSLRTPLGTVDAYKAVFYAVVVIRVVAVFLLRPVQEKGSTDFTETVRQLSGVTPKSFAALRSIRRGGDEASRQEAILSIGEGRTVLATNELHNALYDPSPKVRREAAIALGRFRTLGAAEALLDHAKNHPELVEEEMIEALGDCGEPAAIPYLTQMLQHPSSLHRRTAAKALGRIGDPRAIESLRQAATHPGDPDIRRAALQALRNLEATDPTLYADALAEQHPSVRVAAAEAISELHITELLPDLRQNLSWFQDDASSEVAYALGTIGDESDLELILQAADHTVSETKKRRCLLGAAKLFGADVNLYRLFALEEVARDSFLLREYRQLARNNPDFNRALEAYSSGNEPEALQILATSNPSKFGVWAKYAVPSSFLVAAYLYAHASGN